MIARSLFAGGTLGALAALGLWALRAPVSAQRSTVQEDVEQSESQPAAPASPASTSAANTNEELQPASRPVAARQPDPDFAVIACGQMRDEEGAPVGGATPIFEDAEARRHTAQAGPNGTWSLVGLHPGPVDVSLNISGYLPVQETLEVPALREWRHDFELQRARRLPVRFETPEGAPIVPKGFGSIESYIGVFASNTPPSSPLPGVRGRVLSRYGESEFRSRAERQTPADLDPRYQGILILRSAAPAWVSVACRDQVLETRALAELDSELVFVLTGEQIRGASGEVRVRIVDRGTGAAIDGRFQMQHPSGGIHVPGALVDGVQVFTDVPSGELELRFHADGYEWLEVEVQVPAGDLIDLGTIALGKQEPFVVHVTDTSGAPVDQNVQAARVDLARTPADLLPSISSSADAAGRTEITWLAPGLTLVRCGGKAGLARVARLVDTARIKNVDLVLPAGTEVVFSKDNGASSAAQYRLEDAQGLALSAGHWVPREIFLAPGDYTLRSFVAGAATDAIAVHVGQERAVVRYGGE